MHVHFNPCNCNHACAYHPPPQEWQPATARGGDSQDSQDADSPTMGPSNEEPAEPPTLGQRLFSDSQDLSDLTKELERALEDVAPPVSVPGAPIPQILGVKPDAGSSPEQPATELATKTVHMGAENSIPLPTPCRSSSIPQMDSQMNKAQKEPGLEKIEHA